MARDGVFDELDAAVSWHPYDLTQVRTKTLLANVQVLYKFDGVAAHAGAKPVSYTHLKTFSTEVYIEEREIYGSAVFVRC